VGDHSAVVSLVAISGRWLGVAKARSHVRLRVLWDMIMTFGALRETFSRLEHSCAANE
jgi:hypothetical protein